MKPIKINLGDDNLALLRKINTKMNSKQRKAAPLEFKLPPPIVRPDYGSGATQAEMEEYEAIIKKGKIEKDGDVKYSIDADKSATIYKTYTKMSKEQRKSSSQLPPPPPPMEPRKSKEEH